MAAFPLDPPLARSLVASFEHGCPHEVLSILSVLSASSKLFHDATETREAAAEARLKFRHPSGDHMTALNVLNAYEDVKKSSGKKHERREWCRAQFVNERCLSEALDIREQLRGVCDRMGAEWDWKVRCGEGNEGPVLKSLLTGLVHNSAFLQADGSYKQTMGQSVRLSRFRPSTLC